jgi:glycerol-3-phosphate dehydrogenase
VIGVAAEDRLTSEQFDIRAGAVVNAAGPWAASLLQALEGRAHIPAPLLSRAMNLVTRPIPISHGCGGRAGGRFLFLAPWRNVSLVGTSHDAHIGDADALKVTRWDLEAFLADIREAFPHANFSAGDVRLIHRGLLPMVSGDQSHVRLLRESTVVDHARDGASGLISMFGVRYTTARHTAACAVDAVFGVRGDRHPPPSRTDRTPVAGGAITNKENFLRAVLLRDVEGVPAEMLKRLALTYGAAYDGVLQMLRDEPALAYPLGRHCPVSRAEILYAVRNESALKLADAVIRRTEAGSAGHPGVDAIEHAASIMARELKWDEWRVGNEVAEVEAFYRLPT